MSGLLKLIPTWAWPWIAGIGLSLAVGLAQQVRVWSTQAELADESMAHSSYRLEVAERDRRAATAAMAETKRRIEAMEEVERNARGEIESARADADRAGGSLERLQQRYAESERRSRECGNTFTAQLSETAESAGRMRADVFRRVGEAARLYARVADERGIAGRACEVAYESLR